METKTHWKKLTNPNYLGAWDFQPGEEKVLTIKEVKREPVQNQNGTENCTVAYFDEDVKPLILNKTNAGMIAKVWGTPFLEDWPGCKIKLKVKRVKAFGEMTDAVRVSNERPADNIICEVCGKPIMAIPGRTAQDVAAATKAKYGKTMCADCAKKGVNNA